MATGALAIASYVMDAILLAVLAVAVACGQAEARRRDEQDALQPVRVKAEPKHPRGL
jgi:hypothetical protein